MFSKQSKTSLSIASFGAKSQPNDNGDDGDGGGDENNGCCFSFCRFPRLCCFRANEETGVGDDVAFDPRLVLSKRVKTRPERVFEEPKKRTDERTATLLLCFNLLIRVLLFTSPFSGGRSHSSLLSPPIIQSRRNSILSIFPALFETFCSLSSAVNDE